MNTKTIFRWGSAFLLATTILTGCSDEFLKDIKDYSKVDSEVYNDYGGAKGRIDNIYMLLLPEATASVNYQRPSSGSSDIHSQCTEEYSGSSQFIDDRKTVTTAQNLPSFWGDENKTSTSTYGRIRNCNDAIYGITNSTLSDKQKEELLGQAYFFRAWTYYLLVKTYGGVPIETEVREPTGDNPDGLFVPRSTTKECIDFICADLALAAKYLPLEWGASDYGRVTAGSALALQGRARLLYASPLFNRADDVKRWEQAYQSNKNALDTLALGGFGLAYENGGGVNGSNWAKMFSDYKSSEAVFVTLYNNVDKPSGTANPHKHNGWENSIRPKNTGGSNGKNTTAMMVDMFPMADGKKPGVSTEYPYDENMFMLNRDPRFYRTFAFPGVKWTFSGSLKDGSGFPYQYGATYELWNYAWYAKEEDMLSIEKKGTGADGLATDYQGIYIRKRSDDLGVNSSPLYKYRQETGTAFAQSGAPYMEIRFAEVLLNYAESACGAGHYAEAVDALKKIRRRAGIPADDGSYGLASDLETNRAKLFEAILYERQIELAYEGKRFDDMRRWLLWDGGVGQESIHSTWKVTGFDGNTCNYLGVEPLNGKRRDGLEMRAVKTATSDPYPIATNGKRPAAWDLSKEEVISEELETFYRSNLIRKTRLGDDKDIFISFKSNCYLIGLNQTIQKSNLGLEQTIGWDDYNNGNSSGTFDPIKE